MANPLPNEKELYDKIKEEGISINIDIWDLLYNRIGDDISTINLLCRYYLDNHEPLPIEEAKRVLIYTRHIKDIVNKLTHVSKEDFPFPEFLENAPLHPVLREMFTHYIGNDVYMMNLIIGDFIDPLMPKAVTVEAIAKILKCISSIKTFMNKLREATSQEKNTSALREGKDKKHSEIINNNKALAKEDIFSKIKLLLAEEFKITNEDRIKPETYFSKDLNLDSVDAIRVIMVLEENFGIEIPDQDAEGVLTVSQAVDYIYKRLREV